MFNYCERHYEDDDVLIVHNYGDPCAVCSFLQKAGSDDLRSAARQLEDTSEAERADRAENLAAKFEDRCDELEEQLLAARNTIEDQQADIEDLKEELGYAHEEAAGKPGEE